MKKYYLAYFDILGYSERIANRNITEEYQIHENFINDAKICNEKFVYHSDLKSVSYINFSDTHIFYIEDEKEESFGSIIGCSLCFMNLAAIRKDLYLPVRGCITYGDFIADLEKNIIIGDALRRAYDLENKQEWCGCCLSPEVIKKVQNSNLFNQLKKCGILVNYDVPLKKAEKCNTYVINMESFPRLYGEQCKDMPITKKEFWENIFMNKIIDPNGPSLDIEDAKTKLENTQKFFEYIDNIKDNFNKKNF